MPVRVRWRGLELPVHVKVDRDSLSDRYGSFFAEPFERGYGHTIGNSLRRVLLSSLEGSAVVAVRIQGVQQEFSALPGVLEDVTEIVLNIKELVVKLYTDEERTLRINVSGREGEVTGADIETDVDTEIMNPDHKICTITDAKASFVCEMYVRRGRGYVPVEEMPNVPEEIGLIPIDGLFSPVQRVSYQVEDTRVGQKTNYDRLILNIWTNGVVTPEMALVEAAKILRKHTNPFVQYFERARELPAEKPGLAPEPRRIEGPKVAESKIQMTIAELKLSVRASNCLEVEGIRTVGELLCRTESELLKVKNFGKTSLLEVKQKLGELDLEMGMLVGAEKEPIEE